MSSEKSNFIFVTNDEISIVKEILKLTPSQINQNDITKSLFRCCQCKLVLEYHCFNKFGFNDFISQIFSNKFSCCNVCSSSFISHRILNPIILETNINPNVPEAIDCFIDGKIPMVGIPGKEYERTFFAIKPDGVKRKLIGNIITRFENKGYTLIAMKLLKPTLEIAQQHYIEHKDKSFFDSITTSLSSGPIMIMIWEGHNIIKGTRSLMGKTNPNDSKPGTIRGDLSASINANICHGSDSIESAAREIKLWFNENELY